MTEKRPRGGKGFWSYVRSLGTVRHLMNSSAALLRNFCDTFLQSFAIVHRLRMCCRKCCSLFIARYAGLRTRLVSVPGYTAWQAGKPFEPRPEAAASQRYSYLTSSGMRSNSLADLHFCKMSWMSQQRLQSNNCHQPAALSCTSTTLKIWRFTRRQLC